MFGRLIDSVVDTVEEVVSDPVGFTVQTVSKPVLDTVEVLEGLTEGELRLVAIRRLGTDAALGMTISEIIEELSND